MRKVVWIALVLLALAAPVFAQTVTISCTDSTNTNCTIKKNQPFSVTHDAADPADSIVTEKWRLYLDGVKVSEQPALAGAQPVYVFAVGLSDTGDHTMYAEAIGTAYDVNGQASEVSSGPSNVVTVRIVTGSLSAPKNVHIIK